MIHTVETLLSDQIQRIENCFNPDTEVLEFIEEINLKD